MTDITAKLAEALRNEPLPTQVESDECDSVFAFYRSNLKGFPAHYDDYRAGWFASRVAYRHHTEAQAPQCEVCGRTDLCETCGGLSEAQAGGTEGEREKFEAWAKEFGRIFLNRAGSGYEYGFTNEAWVAWQARAALSSAPATPAGRTLTAEAEAFKAAMKTLHHADYPGGDLWKITTVREKSLMLKAWRAASTTKGGA